MANFAITGKSLRALMVLVLALTGVSLTQSTVSAAPVVKLSMPSRVAPAASLSPGQTVDVTVTATDASASPVAGATVYLKVVREPGGGSASSEGRSLTGSYQPFTANSSGQVVVTYTASAVLPQGGRDTIQAANASSAATATAQSIYAFSRVARFSWTPEPTASPGTLNADTSVNVTARALDASGNAVPGGQVCLSFSPASGGGSASINGTPLSTAFKCFTADATGSTSITYTTPSTLPVTGTDTIYAQDTASTTFMSRSWHGYSFGKVVSYELSPSPMAAAGELKAKQSVTVTLTPRDASGNQVAGATVHLRLLQADGATAVVNNSATRPNGTALSATPLAFVTHSTTKLQIVYKTPSALPPTGTDVVRAQDLASAPTLVATTSYSYVNAC